MTSETTIATWFVADSAETATFFPQVGTRSDAPKTQAVYWRCTAAFYYSSIAQNPAARHVFYTNVAVPVVDGIDLAALFESWGVAVVTLPITYRLPRGSVGSWGNQFYIFDVLRHFAAASSSARLIVLDSDCVWRRPVAEMEHAIDRQGALTYLLGSGNYPEGSPINGQTREGLARFSMAHGGPAALSIPYFGGEIYAATAEATRRVSERAGQLWPDVLLQGEGAPREEAHLLSVIYALEGLERGTANPFIRRMWTTFHHNDLAPSDADLAIWHLPAEKKTGFADLFRQIAGSSAPRAADGGVPHCLSNEKLSRTMGYPRRSPAKFARDLSLKLAEKAGVQ